eukprot:jgi/Hompol1/3900/HPOL_003389-RA
MGDLVSLQSEDSHQLFVDGSLKHFCQLLSPADVQAGAMGDLRKGLFRIEPQLSYKATKANEAQRLRAYGRPIVYGSVVLLRNIACGKYACITDDGNVGNLGSIGSADGSGSHATTTRVTAVRSGASGSLFRILPKFRIRAEGEPVRIADAVIFQAVRTGAFLAVAAPRIAIPPSLIPMSLPRSNSNLGQNSTSSLDLTSRDTAVADGALEACASSRPHGWSIRIFASSATSNDIQSRIVKKGMHIRLYHKEMEGYMTAAPSILEPDVLPILGQEVQLSPHYFDPMNPIETTSALAFWQIEDYDMFQGGPVSWKQPIRLKHAATGLYLRVISSNTHSSSTQSFDGANHPDGETASDSGTGSFTKSPMMRMASDIFSDNDSEDDEEAHPRFLCTLADIGTLDESELDSVMFEMVQVNLEAANVIAGGFVRIRNIATGTWLHAVESKTSLHSRSREDDGVNLGLISATSPHAHSAAGNKYHMMASININPQDYFSLSIVDDDIVERLSFVQSMIPPLLSFVSKERPVTVDDSSVFPITKEEDESIQMILTSLIYFCTISENYDPFTRVGTPQILNQTLLRESGIIQILMWMIQIPFSVEQRIDIRQLINPAAGGPLGNWASSGSVSDVLASDEVAFSLDAGVSIHVPQLNSQRDSGVRSPTPQTVPMLQTLSLSSNHPMARERHVSAADIKTGRERQVIQLLRMIYRLLKQFLLGSDEDNQLHVATHFDLLAEQLDYKLGAADTLMQLISENRRIVQSIGQIQIQRFVRLLVHERDPSFVDFLVALCYCNGQAVHKHQLFIVNYLFGRTSDLAGESVSFLSESGQRFPGGISSLFSLRVVDNIIEVEMPSATIGTVWIPLHVLFNKPVEISETAAPLKAKARRSSQPSLATSHTTDIYPDNRDTLVDYSQITREQHAAFFCAVLRLYEAMCAGHNTICSKIITNEIKIISLDMCKCGILDERLPSKVRSAFMDLCRVIYLDKFSQSPVVADFIFNTASIDQEPKLEVMLAESALKEDFIKLTDFKVIADWILQFLPQSSVDFYACNINQSDLVLSSLRVIRFLVSYGYFCSVQDFVSLLNALIGILDGRYFGQAYIAAREANDSGMTPGERAHEAANDRHPNQRQQRRSSMDSHSNTPQRVKIKTTHPVLSATEADTLMRDRHAVDDTNRDSIASKIEACNIVEMFLGVRVQMRVMMFAHLWRKHQA